MEELRIEFENANDDVESSKRLKEITEQQRKGFELQLSLTLSFIQSLEARISQIQSEISSIGSKVENLKSEENASRDDFIVRMIKFNTEIRRFQETVASAFQKKNTIGTTAESEPKATKEESSEAESKSLTDMLANIVSQTTKEEQEYLVEQDIQKQVQQEYVDLQRKVSLVGVTMKETKALQDLTRQTAELEQVCASLGEELQKRCVCPSCHADNVESLGGILQGNGET